MIGLPQPITGPFVNFMLILTTLIINPTAGILLGSITPLIAVLRGQLPPLLLPMVPFIIAGNAVLVIFFSLPVSVTKTGYSKIVRQSAPWIGILLGAFLKFVLLYFSATLVLPILFVRSLPDPVIAMMALPQFITAIVGGVLALFFHRLLSKLVDLH